MGFNIGSQSLMTRASKCREGMRIHSMDLMVNPYVSGFHIKRYLEKK